MYCNTNGGGQAANPGCPAIRVVMFPKDTNPAGNIFGGVILSYIDIAAGVAARGVTHHRTVTVCMKEVVFEKPVKVGDICTFWTEIIKTGRTSITIRVRVEAERGGEIFPVTEGEAIFVAVDKLDRPIPLDSPLGTLGGPVQGEGTDKEPVASPAPAAEPKHEAGKAKNKKNKKKKKSKKK
ncbi:MAG: acyl-CoA thioesterase [Candidatus Melainabacteria bacterium]|jgi:acyl-CoA thioesterase YciA|nr:acyl-CoA thioesterase [Candidatus Melainabacteria bacterium]